MFAPFDSIRIINLPERRDRRQEISNELYAIGLGEDPRVSFFTAVRPTEAGPFSSVGARGCYESHLAILREAAAANRSVLILEDDCDFTPEATNFEFGSEWDVFYGGYHARNPEDLLQSDIAGSHMMGFSSKGANQICAYLDTLQFEGIHPPIDAAYIWFRRAHPDVPTLFAMPPLGIQRPSRSDIADLRFFDRLKLLRPVLHFARQIKRRVLR